jgi:putative two-component system response regulator
MSRQSPNVLLIDDERTTIELMGAVLETQGFEVHLCHTTDQALRLLETIQFDAVVTDVVFEGRSEGSQLLAACRKLQPTAVAILMTGYPAIDSAVSAIKGGAMNYLQKPVDPTVLGAMVHKALRERQLSTELDSLRFGDMVDILSEMVASTIERVDPYTAGHAERTRRYSRILGESFSLDRPTLERLELGAIAHDYGKIYLDDLGFLTKKGRLTPAEYKEVQRHPALGAEKLGAHPQLREVCTYVAEHHERWDGLGYPYGLKGEDITLPGRILGVVEVFDSLSTRRSYKPAWDLDRTQGFFAKNRGEAFDPDVIDEFQKLLEVNGEEWIAQPQKDLEAAGIDLG